MMFAAPSLSKATPHNLRLTPQAAYHAKIFRDIFQKCAPIYQGLAVLFGSSHKKFSGVLHHLELCGIALKPSNQASRTILSPPKLTRLSCA